MLCEFQLRVPVPLCLAIVSTALKNLWTHGSLVHVCENQNLCRRTKLEASSTSILYQKDWPFSWLAQDWLTRRVCSVSQKWTRVKSLWCLCLPYHILPASRSYLSAFMDRQTQSNYFIPFFFLIFLSKSVLEKQDSLLFLIFVHLSHFSLYTLLQLYFYV